MGNFNTGLSCISYKSKCLPKTPRCCRVHLEGAVTVMCTNV